MESSALTESARPQWYAHGYNRAELYRLAAAMGWLPRRLRLGLSRRIGRLAQSFLPAERAATRKTLEVMTGATGRRLDELTAEVFGEFAMCFSDLITASRRPARIGSYLGVIRGRELLQGVDGALISLTAHVGNWELAGRVLAQHSERTTHVVVAVEEARALERWLRRDGRGLRFVPRSHPTVSLTLMAALRRGDAVALQGDRALGNRGDVLVPFFAGGTVSSRARGRSACPPRVLHARWRRPLRAARAPAHDDRAWQRGGGARRLGRHARANRRREADPVVQLLRRVEPLRPVTEVVELEEAERRSRELAAILPPRISPPFTGSFIRSATLYDEYVLRLTLGIFCTTGLAKAAEAPGTTDELVARAGFEPGRARVPVDWMLRRLSHRGILAQRDVDGRSSFQLHGQVPELDPAEILEAQRRQDVSWQPSYVLAEMVAQDYPVFLRGERTGEEVLFSPSRLRLWVNFFSNDNGLYVVNNLVGAAAVVELMPPAPVAVMELGGGLGSGAAALLDELRRSGRWADVREYRFTELVPFFMRRGQQALQMRFPDASFLTFGALDMNVPFAGQGVAPGSVSLVYAVNTLHVARDLDFTLREILGALVPGGRLVVSECIRTAPAQAIYIEFIFNLMETFRSPVLHPSYRPNGGFLAPEEGQGAMEAAGFVDVRMLPDIPSFRERFPHFQVGAVGATRPG